MKKLILILIAFAMVSLINAQVRQENHSRKAEKIPEQTYKKYYDIFYAQPNDKQRITESKTWLDQYYLTSAQVKNLAQAFYSDEERLSFAMAAYPMVIDKENFYDVYDVFAYFSTVFRLHDFVHGLNIAEPIPQQPQLMFPNLNYPVWSNYNGPHGCSVPVNNDDFLYLASQVASQPNEPDKLEMARNITRQNCMAVADIMRIASLLQMEPDRLMYFKTIHNYAWDVMNFEACAQLLSQPSLRNELLDFLGESRPPHGNDPLPPTLPCIVDQLDFEQIKASIQKQSFNNTKLTLAKQIVSSKKCFNTGQISELTRLFDFASSKLEFAKYAFDFCLDKANYYRVTDALDFENSKTELLKYIREHE
jgi:hypothetical protein